MDPYYTLPEMTRDFGPLRPDPNAPAVEADPCEVRTSAPAGCNCPHGRLVDRLKAAFPNATIGGAVVVAGVLSATDFDEAAARR